MVNEKTAPAMTALIQRGVRFANTHSLFPTFTTASASAMATGHYLGDTGDFSSNIYVGFPMKAAGDSPFAPLENNNVLAEVDRSSAISCMRRRSSSWRATRASRPRPWASSARR